MMKSWTTAVALILLFTTIGCASLRPPSYMENLPPEERDAQIKKDRADCEAIANDFPTYEDQPGHSQGYDMSVEFCLKQYKGYSETKARRTIGKILLVIFTLPFCALTKCQYE